MSSVPQIGADDGAAATRLGAHFVEFALRQGRDRLARSLR